MEPSVGFYKEFISFKSIFYFCSVPIRLDSYKGCSFGCLYCFSRTLNNRQTDFFNSVISAKTSLFQRRMKKTQIQKYDSGVINSCLVKRVPIHFGSVSDPFQPIERKLRISHSMLKILADYSYPTIISTKSTLICEDDYLDLLKNIPVSIQISFSTFDNDLARKLEPNVPSPDERLQCLNYLAENGFYTVARLQPYLVNHSGDLERIVRTLYENKVKHLVVEHLRIPTNSTLQSRDVLWKNIGENYLRLYREIGIKKTRINFELLTEYKLQNTLNFKNLCHSFGITFGSGDNDLHHLSDSYCCCGIPNVEGFENFYKGHLGYIAYKAIREGKIDVSSLCNCWQPTGSIREFINSDCRLSANTKIYDYLFDRVSNNKRSNSLDSFYGFVFDQDKGYHIDERKRKKLASL